MNAEFNPPIVAKYWEVGHYKMQNGRKVCSVSSGYNGIAVLIALTQEGEDIAVKSNRRMEPGATLTVNGDGYTYETYDSYFRPADARALVEKFVKGGKAYVEWSEFSGSSSRERVHVQNIVQLDNFSGQLKECRDSLGER